MKIRYLRTSAIVLGALTVGMKLAHVLELGPKMQWDAELYFPVQTSLYKLFAIFGPIVDIGAIVSIIALVVMLRGRAGYSLNVVALVAMLGSLAIWLFAVAPANSHLVAWMTNHTVPDDWMRWRDQWQFGQLGCFVFDFSAFVTMVISVIRETPNA